MSEERMSEDALRAENTALRVQVDALTEERERLRRWSDDNDPDAQGKEDATAEAKESQKQCDRYKTPFSPKDYVSGFEMAMCYVNDMLTEGDIALAAATAPPLAGEAERRVIEAARLLHGLIHKGLFREPWLAHKELGRALDALDAAVPATVPAPATEGGEER